MTTGTIEVSPRIRRNIAAYGVPSVVIEEVIAIIGWHVDQIQRSYATAITSEEQMDGGLSRLNNHTRRLHVILSNLNGHNLDGTTYPRIAEPSTDDASVAAYRAATKVAASALSKAKKK